MRILGILAILAGVVVAQPQPDPGTTTEGRKVGRVEGVVMNALTNAPLARATVVLQSTGPRNPAVPMVMIDGANVMAPQDSPVSAATGADGKFVVENVPEGTYATTSSRTGFVTAFGGPNPPFKVSAGGSVKDIVIKLMPQGIVTGRVVDSEGEPMQHVMVSVARRNYGAPNGGLLPMGSASTNDLGEFRLANLPPGKYYLVATPNRMGGVSQGKQEAYPATFYPNASDLAGATQVQVDAGAELKSIDFRLKRQSAVTISGTVTPAPEGPLMLMLAPTSGDLASFARMGMQRPTMVQQGKFSAPGILPGSYEIRIDSRPQQGGATLYGRRRIEVGNDDVKDIDVTLGPGPVVTGSFRFEGGTLPAGFQPRIALRGLDGMGTQMVPAEGDLTFKIPNVAPGLWNPMIMPVQNFYIKSIRVDDHDADQPIDARGGSNVKIDILMAAGGGQVSGTVEGADGKPASRAVVSFHPQDAPSGPMRPDRDRVSMTDASGAFNVKNLPPGVYRVFAWDANGEAQYRDENFRKEFESKSVTVKLSDTGKETISLKANPMPK